MNYRRISLLLIGLVVLGLSIAACAPAATPTKAPAQPTKAAAPAQPTKAAAPKAESNTIRIGFVADVTGVGYLFAQSQLAGLKIAIQDVNSQGGVLGKKLEYIMRDSQLKPDIGATMARQLILEDNVDFLLGPTSSSVALAVSEVAKEYKKVVGFHTSNTAELTTSKGHPYLFQVVPNTTIEGRAVAEYVAKQGYKKIGFIGPDYSFGHDEFNAFEARLKEANPDAKIVSQQWPKLGERDLTSFITALQSANPDVIYSNLWGDQLVTFVQQAQPLGVFDKTPFIGLFDLDALKSAGTDLSEGIVGYSRAPFYGIDTPQMKAFVGKYQKLTKSYPSDWAIMTYDAVMGLVAAINKAGTTDSDAVAKALDDLKFQSLRGELTIRACDHMANVGEYIGTTVKDPKYPFLIMKDVQYIPAEKVWNTCDEVAKMRAAK